MRELPLETTRAIGAIFVRNMVREKGPDAERRFQNELSPDENQYFQTAIANSWVPVAFINKVYRLGAEIVYPNDPRGLQYLGEAMARNHLIGIYKIFLSIATVPFLVAQCPKLWKAYNREGRFRVEWNEGDTFGKAIVEDIPDLPETYREVLSGYITGALSLAGCENVHVVHNDEDENAWKWIASWKTVHKE
jgi:hypothetical protein